MSDIPDDNQALERLGFTQWFKDESELYQKDRTSFYRIIEANIAELLERPESQASWC